MSDNAADTTTSNFTGEMGCVHIFLGGIIIKIPSFSCLPLGRKQTPPRGRAASTTAKMQGFPYDAVVTYTCASSLFPFLFIFPVALARRQTRCCAPTCRALPKQRCFFFIFPFTFHPTHLCLPPPPHPHTQALARKQQHLHVALIENFVPPKSSRARAVVDSPMARMCLLLHTYTFRQTSQAGKATWQTERSVLPTRDQWRSQLSCVWPRRGRQRYGPSTSEVCVPSPLSNSLRSKRRKKWRATPFRVSKGDVS